MKELEVVLAYDSIRGSSVYVLMRHPHEQPLRPDCLAKSIAPRTKSEAWAHESTRDLPNPSTNLRLRCTTHSGIGFHRNVRESSLPRLQTLEPRTEPAIFGEERASAAPHALVGQHFAITVVLLLLVPR